MIFTKALIDNLYGFENFEIDLTYPRKSSNPLLDGEYLSFAPSFKFKKACVLLGTNASGKTSLGKILCSVQQLLRGDSLVTRHYLAQAIRNKKQNGRILVEFVLPEVETLNRVEWLINHKGDIEDFQFFCVQIKSNDTNVTATRRLDSSHTLSTASKDNPDALHDLQTICELNINYYYVFAENHPSNLSLTDDLDQNDLPMVLSILKTFDPSIVDVKPLYTDKNDEKIFEGYTVFFQNADAVIITDKGESFTARDKNRFSKGTYDMLSVVGFISAILKTSDGNKGCTYFLDEKLASSHSELETFVLNLMIRKLQKDSQLFYTTHNHDVLDIQLPTHSFVFLHKNNEITVIEQPEKLGFSKNDRNLKGYVQCNYFETMPSTHLLDELWGAD